MLHDSIHYSFMNETVGVESFFLFLICWFYTKLRYSNANPFNCGHKRVVRWSPIVFFSFRVRRFSSGGNYTYSYVLYISFPSYSFLICSFIVYCFVYPFIPVSVLLRTLLCFLLFAPVNVLPPQMLSTDIKTISMRCLVEPTKVHLHKYFALSSLYKNLCLRFDESYYRAYDLVLSFSKSHRWSNFDS